jgi:hypothetical protein
LPSGVGSDNLLYAPIDQPSLGSPRDRVEFRHVAERHIKELIAAEEAQETLPYAA